MPSDISATGHDAFTTLSEAYLDELFADSPATATFQGWDGLDDRSPDLTAEAIVDRERCADEWLTRFRKLDGEQDRLLQKLRLEVIQ